MAVNEQIVSSVYRVFDKGAGLWHKKSFWTKASDVEFEDGENAEDKLKFTDTKIDSVHNELSEDIKSIQNDMGNCTFSVAEDGAYVTYTPLGGADPVSKKLGEPIYLGSGTSFDVKQYYAKYSELTIDNFYIKPSGSVNTSNFGFGEDTGHNIGQVGITSLTSSIVFSYDSSTGVLTAYLTASSRGGVNNTDNTMKTATGTAAVKAYLIA